jgi:endoglucanase
MISHCRTCRLKLFFAILLLTVTSHVAAEPPVRIADQARLDLVADAATGELRDFQLVRGDGDAERMKWLEPSKQSGSITAQFTIWPVGWREFELRFTPERSGSINVDLLGPWQSLEKQTVRQEVLWDAIRVEGAKFEDGSFEQTSSSNNASWKQRGGTIVDATGQIPAVDGKRYAKTWHDGRLTATLRVTANQPVRIQGFARAALPAGYVDMARIDSRDTPAHRAAKKFLRGVNLGNYLEAPPGQNWGARYSAEDFEYIKDEGFDHVRIPIGWHHFTGPAPEYQLRDSIFEKVDFMVREASQRGLNIMINVHHFDAFTSNPAKERARFLAIWRQIAEHYAAASEGVVYEVLNEPKDAADTET